MPFDPPLNAEERLAWDIACAGALACPDVSSKDAGLAADEVVRNRRERFGDRPGMADQVRRVENIAVAAIRLGPVVRAAIAKMGDASRALVEVLDREAPIR